MDLLPEGPISKPKDPLPKVSSKKPKGTQWLDAHDLTFNLIPIGLDM